jgi:hypothetical protein
MAKKTAKRVAVELTEEHCNILQGDFELLATEPKKERTTASNAFSKILEKNFDVLHDAIVNKKYTKNELVKRWNDAGIPVSLFLLNKHYNQLKKDRGIETTKRGATAAEPQTSQDTKVLPAATANDNFQRQQKNKNQISD